MHKRCEDHVPHSCGVDLKKMSDMLTTLGKSGSRLSEKDKSSVQFRPDFLA